MRQPVAITDNKGIEGIAGIEAVVHQDIGALLIIPFLAEVIALVKIGVTGVIALVGIGAISIDGSGALIGGRAWKTHFHSLVFLHVIGVILRLALRGGRIASTCAPAARQVTPRRRISFTHLVSIMGIMSLVLLHNRDYDRLAGNIGQYIFNSTPPARYNHVACQCARH